MAAGRDLVRTSDVTLWGGVALAAWAAAVLGANLSALLPQSVLTALHASRLDGGTLNQLRGQVAGLTEEAARLRRDNASLSQRFDLAEQQSGAVTRRVGVLEAGVPEPIETHARQTTVDHSAITAATPEIRTFVTEGGEVSVRHVPLTGLPASVPMPPPLEVAVGVPVGLALGLPVSKAGAEALWHGIQSRVGAAAADMKPLLSPADDGLVQLVAGPMPNAVAAEAMCAHMQAVAVGCAVSDYTGAALAD